MMNITKAIAYSIEKDRYPSSSHRHCTPSSPEELEEQEDASILQLNSFPVTINTKEYENAKSGSNPNGDLRPLFAFRQLADPAPSFEQYYSLSGKSTENLFQNFLHGAQAKAGASFTESVINSSLGQFSGDTFANMDGTSGVWRPVYAVPEDWPTADINRYKNLSVDLSGEGEKNSIVLISKGSPFKWQQDGQSQGRPHPSSRINSINLKYLLVRFNRPWFNPLLFETAEWYLSGQKAGFCSSGSLEQNDGVFPLMTTAMLIAKEVKINADWHPSDQKIIQDAKTQNKSLALGPLTVVMPPDEDRNVQIIGYLSQLIPFSPQMDGKEQQQQLDR